MEELKRRSTELQTQVDEFKNSDNKPERHWENVRQLISVNYEIIRIKYHG